VCPALGGDLVGGGVRMDFVDILRLVLCLGGELDIYLV
jgi:hypothetical protein